MPTLFDIVNPPEGQKDAKRRVIITSELHGGQAPWLVGTYQLLQETPFTFTSTSQFNCNPNRGGAGNPLLLVNHWLRPDGPPDPGAAVAVNSAATENKRLQECILARHRLPNVLAVDFFAVGDTIKVVNTFNAAVSDVLGVTAFWNNTIAATENDVNASLADRADAGRIDRLPPITHEQAVTLLGQPLINSLQQPDRLKEIQLNGGNTTSPPPSPSTTLPPG
jgi:hypothetical protein